jgi:hypothetical protein
MPQHSVETSTSKGMRAVFVAVASTVAVVGLVLALAVGGNNANAPTVASGRSASAPDGSAEPLTCGDALPKPIAIPDGFVASDTQSIDAVMAAPVAGQLVSRWVGTAASLESRWPSDESVRPFSDAQGWVGTVLNGSATQPGTVVEHVVLHLPDMTSTPCRTLQISVLGSDKATVDAVARQLLLHPFVADVPLVVGSEERTASVSVAECPVPAGADRSLNRVTETNESGSPSPEAQAALRAFLRTHPELVQFGYVEYRLSDGSIDYGRPAPNGTGVIVTVIHVSRSESGWTVEGLEASGC